MMITKTGVLLFLIFFIHGAAFANDTLYFRLSNPWNTVKSSTGVYLRKCVKENDHFHCWDYNMNNILVTESFYTDTNFTLKLFCHKYFNEIKGFLEQTRCYLNGQLNGYRVIYNEKGDTIAYYILDNGHVIKEWSSLVGTKTNSTKIIEENAEFPGGQSAWITYLSENIKYPKSLRRKNIVGKIVVKYIVDSTGYISNVEIIQGLHPLLDEELIRVIKNSPRWRPARQNDKFVKATFTQPITIQE